uniref:Uncharacterized protein n=1 Tax=Anguilla anguilla TaxID=7936 RepID=A0A0E9U3J6_ANGAN
MSARYMFAASLTSQPRHYEEVLLFICIASLPLSSIAAAGRRSIWGQPRKALF